jgi:hypothetical protein
MNTTVATFTAGVLVLSDTFNVATGWQYNPPPEDMIGVSQANGGLVVRFGSTPADSITFTGTLVAEELGLARHGGRLPAAVPPATRGAASSSRRGGCRRSRSARPSRRSSRGPVTHLKAKTVGQATRDERRSPLTHRKSKVLGQATETELARSLVRARILGQATEVDTVTSVTVRRGRVIAVGQALEVDVATPSALRDRPQRRGRDRPGHYGHRHGSPDARRRAVADARQRRDRPTIRTTEVVRWPTSS